MEEVKSFYGKDYFYWFFLKDNWENLVEFLDKVIEVVVDVFLNEVFKVCYLVFGSFRFIDIYVVSLDIYVMCGFRFILGVGDGGLFVDIYVVIKFVYLWYINRDVIYMCL